MPNRRFPAVEPGKMPHSNMAHGPRTVQHPMANPDSSQKQNQTGALWRWPRNAARGAIWAYRHTLSPLVGANCRHLPTCSVYGDEAIGRFGLWAGGWMLLARLLRCQPWGTSGIDNVAAKLPASARWYLPWRYARWRGVNGPACCDAAHLDV